MILGFNNTGGVFESQILVSFLKSGGRFVNSIENFLKKSFFYSIFAKYPLKPAVIFLFIVSLVFRSDSTLDVSTISQGTNPTSVLGDKQFGIPIFSLSNILLPLVFVFLLKQYGKLHINLKIWNFEVLFLLFFLIAEFSSLTSYNEQAAFVWMLKLSFGFALYIIFSRLFLEKTILRVILFAFLAAVLINVVVGILQFMTGGLLGLPFENIRTILSETSRVTSFQGTGFFSAVGFLSQPNKLGALFSFFLPVMLIFCLQKNIYLRGMGIVAVIGSIFLTFANLSRWGVASLGFSFVLTFGLIFLFRLIPRNITSTMKIGILSLFILAISVISNQVIFNRFSSFSSTTDLSFGARVQLIDQALFIIKESPFLGIGGGNFSLYLINYDVTESHISDSFPAPVHNFFLLTASELGIAGLVIFTVAFVSFTGFFFAKIGSLDFEMKLIAISLFVACLAFFFNGLWNLNTFESRTGFLFWLVFGLLVNILACGKSAPKGVFK